MTLLASCAFPEGCPVLLLYWASEAFISIRNLTLFEDVLDSDYPLLRLALSSKIDVIFD